MYLYLLPSLCSVKNMCIHSSLLTGLISDCFLASYSRGLTCAPVLTLFLSFYQKLCIWNDIWQWYTVMVPQMSGLYMDSFVNASEIRGSITMFTIPYLEDWFNFLCVHVDVS